jgi:hypothetical protein
MLTERRKKMTIPKLVNVSRICGFHYLSAQIGWIKVQLDQNLFIRIILPADLIHQVQDVWLDYLSDGQESAIQITP